MNVHGQVSSAITRVHESLGHDFHLINFEFDSEGGGGNPYADGDFVPTAESPVTVQGRLESRDADDVSDESGADVEAEETLFVLPDTNVQLAQDADSEARSSEFVDTETDTRYRAVDVEHQDDLLAIHVEEL
ncbi:hypothetical protein G6M89_09265 [Natronolimnobius sp. AArcel1]|uniref:hypothetical protein n=1 Tax=Natronolimnobius sp. AArcel1 TaxID=1679093 RepID=UPI0013EE2E5F|nr:hypothetical protein [Natronolimnobius sp. AArcel1]NGM69193.1 hypothetical protein [Natronolimnobius sp. AArcel1]